MRAYNEEYFFAKMGAISGGGFGMAVSGGCDYVSVGACVPANPGITTLGVATGTAIGIYADKLVEGGTDVPANVGTGPHAGDSVPAGPSATPTKEQQDQINGIGNDTGCHTCGTDKPGTKSGNWVGDHQPPTALNPEGKPQSYYPQCLQCSRVQGGRIRVIKGNQPSP